MAAYLMEAHQTSIGRACRVVSLPRSMYYYRTLRDDSAVMDKLRELSEAYPTEGQDLYYSRIRQQGIVWNYKRVRRVYLQPAKKDTQKSSGTGQATFDYA